MASETKRDWIGDTFLWSLAISIIGIILYKMTDSETIGWVAGLAMTVFGLMCAAAFVFRVIGFFGEMKAVLGRKR